MFYSNDFLLSSIKSLLMKLGIDLKRTASQSTIESHLATALNKYNIDLVIDAGANKGQFGAQLRMIGYKGKIISFEPLSSAFYSLEIAAKNDGNWVAVNSALGNTEGLIEIHEHESSEFSSILNLTHFASDRFGLTNKKATIKKVQLQTLRNYFIKNNIDSNNVFLKMDTQGYDLEVFAGSKGVLDKIKLLQSEISFQSVYQGMPDYRKSISTFETENYFITGIFPVSRNSDLSLIEADLVMARR